MTGKDFVEAIHKDETLPLFRAGRVSGILPLPGMFYRLSIRVLRGVSRRPD
jgi:hypothetical protein